MTSVACILVCKMWICVIVCGFVYVVCVWCVCVLVCGVVGMVSIGCGLYVICMWCKCLLILPRSCNAIHAMFNTW